MCTLELSQYVSRQKYVKHDTLYGREEENLCWPAQYEWHRVMATVWLAQYWHPTALQQNLYTLLL